MSDTEHRLGCPDPLVVPAPTIEGAAICIGPMQHCRGFDGTSIRNQAAHARQVAKRGRRRRISRLRVKSPRRTGFGARAGPFTGLGYQVDARTRALSRRPNNYQSTPIPERSRWECPVPDIDLASIAKKAQRSCTIGPGALSTGPGEKQTFAEGKARAIRAGSNHQIGRQSIWRP